jgi:hypothetical protein
MANANPTSFPTSLLPSGDCGDSARIDFPSIVILGSAALM